MVTLPRDTGVFSVSSGGRKSISPLRINKPELCRNSGASEWAPHGWEPFQCLLPSRWDRVPPVGAPVGTAGAREKLLPGGHVLTVGLRPGQCPREALACTFHTSRVSRHTAASAPRKRPGRAGRSALVFPEPLLFPSFVSSLFLQIISPAKTTAFAPTCF